ncbi:MAG: hypothetical protein BRC25_00765 [Parcubacteria group bacterium SW_6_46_9]|nr:MAG: hypothetical protein BRC25_00765 [Parcubacteria group bacterium SW_6_46_9]
MFNISDEALSLGLNGAYFTITELENRDSDPEFSRIKSDALSEIKAGLSPEGIQKDETLRGFRNLHESVGVSDYQVASPENLLKFVLKRGDLPHVNLLVDIYNLVSVETRLALGAHDDDKVSGDVHLRMTSGGEKYVPLGSNTAKTVDENLYSYMDDENDVICFLEVMQAEKTKVTTDTTDCFYIVQGNSNVSDSHLKVATDRVITLTKRFCGGEEDMLHAPWL